MLKRLAIAGAVVLMTAAAVPQSFAQSIVIGPDGVRLGEPVPERVERRSHEIGERQAVRIARAEGVRDVDDVRRTRSRYIVDGIDRRGDEIRVAIDRRTGDVLSVE